MSMHDLPSQRVNEAGSDIRGNLQGEIMKILWEGGGASVDGVRNELPATRRGAYTTVQTVLNRLAERGLVVKRKEGRSMTYEAAVSEADYLSSSLHRVLEGASEPARRSALLNLVEELSDSERSELRDLTRRIDDRRNR